MRIGPSDVILVVRLKLGASEDSLGVAFDAVMRGPILPSCRRAKSGLDGFIALVGRGGGDWGKGMLAGSLVRVAGDGLGDMRLWA